MTDRVVTVGRPLLPDAQEIASLMEEAISAGWLANNGILHQRLEGALAPYFGTGATRLTSSGTTALMMALQLGDLPPRGGGHHIANQLCRDSAGHRVVRVQTGFCRC